MNFFKKFACILMVLLFLVACNNKNVENQTEKISASEEVEDKYTLSEEYIQNVLENKGFVEGIKEVSGVGDELKIVASIDSEFSADLTYRSALEKAVEIYENIDGLKGFSSARVIVNAPGLDAYGNKGDVMAIDVTLLTEDIEKINYDNFNSENLKVIAKDYQTTQ